MCELRDGKFIELCEGAKATLDPQKGFTVLNYVNMETGKRSQDIMVLKAGDFRKQGMAFTFCPFTGNKIQTWKSKSKPEGEGQS